MYLVDNGKIRRDMAETDTFTEAGKRKHFITYAKSLGLISANYDDKSLCPSVRPSTAWITLK